MYGPWVVGVIEVYVAVAHPASFNFDHCSCSSQLNYNFDEWHKRHYAEKQWKKYMRKVCCSHCV
jgi:hypothetical protein